MPDVGILQLQINDNSEKAAQGLNKLSGALAAVKQAVGGGLKLAPVASAISKVSKAVTESVTPDLTNKINMLADAVRNLREASEGFQMPSMRGLGGGGSRGGGAIGEATESAERIRESVGRAVESASGMGGAFNDVKGGIVEASEADEKFNTVVAQTEDAMDGVSQSAANAANAIRDAVSAAAGADQSNPLAGIGAVENASQVVEGTKEATQTFHDLKEEVQETTESVKNYGNALDDVPDSSGITGIDDDGAGAIQSISSDIDDLLEGMTKADLIRQKMDLLREKMDKLASSGKLSAERATNMSLQYKRLEEQLEKLLWVQRQLEELGDKPLTISYGNEGGGTGNSDFWDNRSDSYITGRYQFHQTPTSTGNNNVAEQLREDTEFVDNLLQNGSKIDTLEMKMESLRDRMIEGVNSGKMNGSQLASLASQYQNLSDRVETLKNATEESESAIDKIKGAIGGFGDSIKKMFPGLTGFGKQMMRIAKYRFIRAIIKEISDGFREGVENVYRYSKAIGSSFSARMDDAAASLQMMKNAIGASVAPLIQSLIPYLETVVNWFISMVNYLNQFLSLLRGQSTWTRPIKASANAFDDVKNSAQGASAAMKDLLADWDELNIIQSENNGGGGGGGLGTVTDYLSMFEEVSRFDNAIKKIVDYIKDNLDDILKIAKAIGVALLAWKISSSVSDILGKVLGGIVVSALEFSLVFDGVKSLITDGFNWGAFWETVVGFLTGVFGIWKITGSFAAGLAIGTTIAVVATLSAIRVARMESYAEMAKNAFSDSGEGGVDPEKMIKAVQDRFNELTKGNSLVIETYAGAEDVKMNISGLVEQVDNLNAVMFGDKKPSEEDVASFKETWKQIFDSLNQLSKQDFSTMFAGLTAAFSSTSKEIREQAKEMRTSLLMTQEGISEAEARLRVETENYAAEIASGNMTNADKYFANLQVIADSQRSTIHTLEELDTEMGDIDFTSVESVVDFISRIGEASDAAVQESAQANKAAIDAAETEKIKLQAYAKAGLISDSDYKTYLESLDAFTKLMKRNGETEADEIASTTTGIYQRILDQAVGALLNGDEYKGANKEQIQSYVDTIIRPIVDAMVKYPDSLSGDELKALQSLPDKLIGVAETETYYGAHATGAGWLWGWLFDQVFGTSKNTETASDWQKQFQTIMSGIWDPKNVKLPRRGLEEVRKQFTEAPEFDEMVKAGEEKGEEVGEEFGKSTADSIGEAAVDAITGWKWGNLGDAIGDALYIPADESNNEDFRGLFQIPEMTDEDLENFKEWYNAGEILSDVKGLWDSIFHKPEQPQGGTSFMDDWANSVLSGATDIDYEIDTSDLDGAFLPAIDTSKLTDSIEDAKVAIKNTVDGIFKELYRLKGISLNFDLTTWGRHDNTGGGYTHGTAEMRASGGFVRSGDLVMANENGNFEMMGRMGNQPVVANNQQIVDGISSGVAQANGGLDARMSNIETLLNRILQKEFTAKAVPDSSWGRHAARSAEQYSKVTG